MRRRGIYKVKIHEMALMCVLCGHDTFSHREVYLFLTESGKFLTEGSVEQLTLQKLCCQNCGDIRMFKEQYDSHISYDEVPPCTE
ncbi:hypothetical protein FOH38_22755 [Lysinibacillus fusiformis]|nr:hypothetical protein FOH38_22755 [Lysinibacillus fusiformis]